MDELAELSQAWRDLTWAYARRRPLGDAESRGPGVVPVNLTLVKAPLRPTPSGG